MKDHKKCKHCDSDNTNPYFCDWCGRPCQEEFLVDKEKEVTLQTEEKPKVYGNP